MERPLPMVYRDVNICAELTLASHPPGYAAGREMMNLRYVHSEEGRSMTGLDAFNGKKYLNLETYRRNGSGVRTPVWFAAAPAEVGGAKLYVYTTADSGKAKRIRRTGTVRIAPCDARGNVTGNWIAAHATIVGAGAFERGMKLLNHKYRPWKQILDLSVLLFPRHRRIMIAIQLD